MDHIKAFLGGDFMKRIIAIAMLIILSHSVMNASGGRARVSFGMFYDSLSPYGEWVTVPDYGYCWRPNDVDKFWRPYMNGRWVWSDYGWLWVSYEDWGWATYHYGRWVDDDYYGWVWVPDYEWAPAWVEWRMSDGYIGWAPLPLRARWHTSIGMDVDDYGMPHHAWCFTTCFGFYVDHPVIYGAERNSYFLRRTRNITNIYIDHDRIINGGPEKGRIERISHRDIRRVEIEDERNHDGRWETKDRFDGSRVRIFRPIVRQDTRNDLGSRIRAGVTRVRRVDDGSINNHNRTGQGYREENREPRNETPKLLEGTPRRPEPESQPRFNIHQRSKDRREMDRHNQTAAPQIERRQIQTDSRSERKNEDRRIDNSREERSSQNRHR